jgi:4-hydroxybenzoyl-CoA thioesterase
MTRLKLDLPESFAFETEIPIRITDINYGGHLGNDAVLSLVHEARVRFLASMGYEELNIEGIGLIMTDALIVFKEEGFYGDTLTICVASGKPEGNRFDLFYHLLNATSGKEIARVKTGLACFDYSRRKSVQVPDLFIKRLGFV